MDALIGNLQTHEMNRNQDTSKKDVKKDKSLALKISSGEISSKEEVMSYLTKRFQNIMRKHGGFRKGGNPLRAVNASDLCHKCGKAGHFMRDCPMLKAETKEYQRPVGEKDKRRDLKAFAVWGDSSSESKESECPEDASMLAIKDDENVFDGMFTFMAKSDDEEDEEKLTTEKDSMNNILDKFSAEKITLTVHISIIEEQLTVLETENLKLKEQLTVLETENLKLKEQLSIMNEKYSIRKGEASSFEKELEASLNTAETRLALALVRNDQMERDLVRLREELKNSLKWTSSTKLLSNITSQSNYNRKGLGSLNISPSYNPHSKYVYVSDNLLCLQCGRNGHLKRDCPAWKASQEEFSVYSRWKITQNKGPTHFPKSSNMKRTNLPHWSRSTLIIPLSPYWELRLKWVPKSNK
ncbi:hypothetical protein KY289_016235 [Solanum tuberosum]|nr:hypothetical protein KY289_016235 [Solanum tuberosum]